MNPLIKERQDEVRRTAPSSSSEATTNALGTNRNFADYRRDNANTTTSNMMESSVIQQETKHEDEARNTVSLEQPYDYYSSNAPMGDDAAARELFGFEAEPPPPPAAPAKKEEIRDETAAIVQEVKKKRKPIFPEYLMQVVNDETNGDVLQWLPCGTQFTITNYHKFVGGRMEELFHICHMSSFVRKLNRWGFVRECVGANFDVFRHPAFRRDQPELCRTMRNVIPQQRKAAKKAAAASMPPKSNATLEHVPSHKPASNNTSSQEQEEEQSVVVSHHNATLVLPNPFDRLRPPQDPRLARRTY